MNYLRVFVPGRPLPQGSKDAIPLATGRGINRRYTGKVSLVESATGLKAWRNAIRLACLDVEQEPRARFAKHVPVRVVATFVMPRTKSLRKTGPTPPHVVKPDGDKLLRAVCDALTAAGVIHDDAQIIEHEARKRYAEIGEPSGAHIEAWYFAPATHPYDIDDGDT